MDEEIKHIVIQIKAEDEARFRKLTDKLADYALFSEMLDAYEVVQRKSEPSILKPEINTLVISPAEEIPPGGAKKPYRALHGRKAVGMMPDLKNRGKLGFPDF